MLGDQASHQAPLVGQEQVVLQTRPMLEAEPSCPLQTVQPWGRYPLAYRPELCIAADQQRVGALVDELAEPCAGPAPGGCDDPHPPDEISYVLAQVRGAAAFSECLRHVVSRQDDPPARVESAAGAGALSARRR